jgi:hypothetical protein
MTPNDAFIVYKRIDDEIQALEIPLQNYITYQLKDKRKLQIYQSLIDSGVDVEKFFLANCTLNKDFYIDYYKYNPDKCMTLYYSWDEFLVKKRNEYWQRVIEDLKKGYKLNLDDRDKFLEMIQFTDYLLWSVLYPEDLELLLSMDDDDWMKFHMPEYRSRMEFIKRVIRGNMVMKRMKGWEKLREKTLKILTK